MSEAQINKRNTALMARYNNQINDLWKKIELEKEDAVGCFDNLIKKAEVHVLAHSMKLIRLAIANKDKGDFSMQIGRADIDSIELDKLREQE